MENLSPHENILTISLIFRDHAKFILYEAGAKGDGAHFFFDCIEAGHTDFFLPLRRGTRVYQFPLINKFFDRIEIYIVQIQKISV